MAVFETQIQQLNGFIHLNLNFLSKEDMFQTGQCDKTPNRYIRTVLKEV